jgi:hypothetical protein
VFRKQAETARGTIAVLTHELDKERMRLAACGTVARGGEFITLLEECDSDALHAVIDLQNKIARLELTLRVIAVVDNIDVRELARSAVHGDVDIT